MKQGVRSEQQFIWKGNVAEKVYSPKSIQSKGCGPKIAISGCVSIYTYRYFSPVVKKVTK